jgi:O-methyltransferase involved in polyketide biosynthesis
MKEKKPSRTAETTAIHRAMESMKPQDERVCYDPFAQAFLSARYRIIAKIPLLIKFVYWFLAERNFPAPIGEVLARTRYIDDYLEECIGNGIT